MKLLESAFFREIMGKFKTIRIGRLKPKMKGINKCYGKIIMNVKMRRLLCFRGHDFHKSFSWLLKVRQSVHVVGGLQHSKEPFSAAALPSWFSVEEATYSRLFFCGCVTWFEAVREKAFYDVHFGIFSHLIHEGISVWKAGFLVEKRIQNCIWVERNSRENVFAL